MSNVVNLRRAKKAKARGEREKEAANNRVTFGTPKALRKTAKANAEQVKRAHALHEIERDGNGSE